MARGMAYAVEERGRRTLSRSEEGVTLEERGRRYALDDRRRRLLRGRKTAPALDERGWRRTLSGSEGRRTLPTTEGDVRSRGARMVYAFRSEVAYASRESEEGDVRREERGPRTLSKSEGVVRSLDNRRPCTLSRRERGHVRRKERRATYAFEERGAMYAFDERGNRLLSTNEGDVHSRRARATCVCEARIECMLERSESRTQRRRDGTSAQVRRGAWEDGGNVGVEG